MTTITAAQWFILSGALMFAFGVGLLCLVVIRPRPRRPVRSVEIIADRWAAPPRTNPRAMPARTVVMPRVAPPRPAPRGSRIPPDFRD